MITAVFIISLLNLIGLVLFIGLTINPELSDKLAHPLVKTPSNKDTQVLEWIPPEDKEDNVFEEVLNKIKE